MKLLVRSAERKRQFKVESCYAEFWREQDCRSERGRREDLHAFP